mmetsp:Transcript_24689/g.68714  ORF Transcript_24689/g.68714 Transcript_24689/m.68714 type:complete len:90 (-) Transcript_24689:336-605(-)
MPLPFAGRPTPIPTRTGTQKSLPACSRPPSLAIFTVFSHFLQCHTLPTRSCEADAIACRQEQREQSLHSQHSVPLKPRIHCAIQSQPSR